MTQIVDAISVVIPTYNRAHLIKESLQSVLKQTLQPYEIIVVDDFSTDHTEDIVKSLNSPLIKYVKNERKKGANGARNTGILMAQGEYIAFHDSDDLWLPEKLELQHKVLMDNKDLDLCFCTLVKESNTKREIFPYRQLKTHKLKKLLRIHNWISTQTIMIRTKQAYNHLFDERLKRFQDWDFVLRSVDSSKAFHLHKPLVIQKIGIDSITNVNNHLEAYEVIFKKYSKLENYGIYNKVVSQELKLKKNKSIYNQVLLYILKALRRIDYIFRKNIM